MEERFCESWCRSWNSKKNEHVFKILYSQVLEAWEMFKGFWVNERQIFCVSNLSETQTWENDFVVKLLNRIE